MKTLIRTTITALALALGAGVAQAQVSPEPKVKYPKRTIIKFSGPEILGTLDRPAMGKIDVRARTKFMPRLEVRGDFLPELAASCDEL